MKTSSNEQAKNWQFSKPKYICILKMQNSKVGHREWKIKQIQDHLKNLGMFVSVCVCVCVCVCLFWFFRTEIKCNASVQVSDRILWKLFCMKDLYLRVKEIHKKKSSSWQLSVNQKIIN